MTVGHWELLYSLDSEPWLLVPPCQSIHVIMILLHSLSWTLRRFYHLFGRIQMTNGKRCVGVTVNAGCTALPALLNIKQVMRQRQVGLRPGVYIFLLYLIVILGTANRDNKWLLVRKKMGRGKHLKQKKRRKRKCPPFLLRWKLFFSQPICTSTPWRGWGTGVKNCTRY